MTDQILLILGMMAVTYLPRLLPLFVLAQRPLPAALQRFLRSIPYTALGVLIVRGILEAPAEIQAAILGCVGAASVCAWLGKGLLPSVITSILAAFLVLYTR